MKSKILEINNIHASYLRKEILRGITLSLQEKEIVLLQGENGSGKSTILNVIFGLLRPSAGTIFFDGNNITNLSVGERQKKGIGYLLQGARVFPNLSVQENFDLAGIYNKQNGLQKNLGDYFSELNKRKSERVGLLSSGLRQMLSIEMLLAQRPRLLLLDEPTGALAENLSHQILAQIKNYAETNSATVLLVEHFPEASKFAHKQINLTHGLIAEAITN